MKPGAIAAVLLGLAGVAMGQTAAPAQTSSSRQTQPATQQGTPASASTPTPALTKRPLQAKTQPEFDAYKAAVSNENDPAAMEKAADDFAVKFPDSELRVLLYRNVMHAYQTSNNGEKMIVVGRKVLAIDPDDPEALLGVSEALAQRTKDTDIDRDQQLAEALKMAQHSLETIDTDISIPPNTPQEKIDAYKGFLRSSADAVVGAIQFDMAKYPEAEASLRKSIEAYPEQPDPVAVFRLALTLDKQDKYPEALKYANQAVSITQDNTSVGTAARRERDRLIQLTGGVVPAPTVQPPPATGKAPPTQ